MQACNVTLPTPVIFSCIFGVIIPDSHLPKCTKTRLNGTKLRIKCPKCSKHCFRLGLRPRAPWGSLYYAPQTLYSAGGLDRGLNFYHYLHRHFTSSVPSLQKNFCIATVLNTMRQRITAIAQSLILHKTTRYFVENRNENTNKQTLLQRSRAAYAWGIA